MYLLLGESAKIFRTYRVLLHVIDCVKYIKYFIALCAFLVYNFKTFMNFIKH